MRSQNDMRIENRRLRLLIERNKKRKRIRVAATLCAVFLIAFTMFFAGLKFSAITAGAKGFESVTYDKMYKSVMVEQNDSLWDIAERHMGSGYTDTKEYIAEIIELNNLNGTDIHYGEYLCVPYYG